jgi:hypothetical protein
MLISYADHKLAFFYDNKQNSFSQVGGHAVHNGKEHNTFMYNETDFMFASLMVGDYGNKADIAKLEKSGRVAISTAGGVGIPF